MKNVLLTGVPGVGKTTIIQRVLSKLPGPAGGFFTREIREGGIRTGFRIISLDGKEGILAQRGFKSTCRVGRYGVNVEEVERIGVVALKRALHECSLILVDEIGKMELFSEQFQKVVVECLDSPKDVLGTIQTKQIPFLDAIRLRGDVTLVEVTASNREGVPQKIVDMFIDRYTESGES